MADAKFPKGMFFRLANEKAPDYVKGSMLIKRLDAIEFLQSETNEWISLDLKVSRDGKAYAQVNDFKPDPNYRKEPQNTEPQTQTGQYESAPEPDATGQDDEDSLPF